VKVAYGAELLARAGYDTAAAAPEARRLGLTVLACAGASAALRAAALPVDAWLARLRIPARRTLALRTGVVVTTLLVIGAAALAADAPGRFADARATFSEAQILNTPDLRDRLTSAIDNGRIPNWRVALDGFGSSPFRGTGAGTYRLTWDRLRPPPPVKVNDGHSLYLELLSELGVVGLALVLLTLGTMLAGGLWRLGGPERHAHAAFVAAGTMLALHAGVDWDWEMPALFVWLFGAGGVVLARREDARTQIGEFGRTARVLAGLAVLVLALTPALFALSQRPLDRALAAFARRDCATAIDAALAATERLGVRPEPWLMLGYCDARAGQYALAQRAMDAARERDPDNWQMAYGQAIVVGVAGGDARPYAAQALRLNPLDERARALVRGLREARTAARRREVARRAPIPYE